MEAKKYLRMTPIYIKYDINALYQLYNDFMYYLL